MQKYETNETTTTTNQDSDRGVPHGLIVSNRNQSNWARHNSQDVFMRGSNRRSSNKWTNVFMDKIFHAYIKPSNNQEQHVNTDDNQNQPADVMVGHLSNNTSGVARITLRDHLHDRLSCDIGRSASFNRNGSQNYNY